MPELPELEISRQRLDPKILNRPLQAFTVLDERLLRDFPSEELRAGLLGASFTGIARFGHYLLLEVAQKGVLLLSLSNSAAIQQVRPQEEPPKNTRLGLLFQDGGGLAVVDPQARTWLTLIQDEEEVPDLGTFGPDALNGSPDPEEWREALQARRAQIKGLLLEPTLIAGLGPLFTDEILFQAGIRPDRRASDLGDEEADRLREAVRATLQKAVQCQANPQQLPKSFLTRARSEEREDCPKCGGPLEKRQIQGRASVFCPACQS
ncbi:Fpg/Nei family DNA glycosylase [Thiohalorhabdus sp. Cl-TMA]|uniref:Fpg/Nei family DNA glycosylase n=1 Tax=Thiohalorhabdus methylotrophus TaxID=3242694 RepID=A0ABV4TT27_9GAMM